MLFRIPLPPPANNLFLNPKRRGRRPPSARYTQWITDAGWEVRQQTAGAALPHFDRYSFHLILPDSGQGDADGRMKAAIDLFVKLGVTAGDGREHLRRQSSEFSSEVPDKEAIAIIEAVR